MKGSLRIASFLLVMAAGCKFEVTTSEPPSTNPPNEPPTNGTIQPEARMAALAAITAKSNALTAATVDERRQELLTYLRGRPELADAGESIDGGLWATFKDGRPLIIVANAPDFDSSDASQPRNFDRSPPTASQQQDVAESVQARILLGGQKTLSQSVNTELGQMLKKRNYTLVGSGLATVDELKTVQGDGVFYFRGHGGYGVLQDRSMEYAPLTATPASVANDLKYIVDWDNFRLAYSVKIRNNYLPSLDSLPPNAVYAFTAEFVKKYFTFAPGSIVYFSACFSAGTANPTFRDAFREAGAGGYWGWDGSFTDGVDNKASLYVFDRLLGLNDFEPESPKQRPFDSPAIKADLALHKHYDDAGNAVELLYFPGKIPAGPLTPSIKFMDVDEAAGKLYLTGMFGSTKPVVRINGVPVNVAKWNDQQIVADIPQSGTTAAGEVVVFDQNRPSNMRVLNEWEAPFHIEFVEGHGAPPLLWGGDINVHFRADARPFREAPGESPAFRTVPINVIQDSKGDITASGRYVMTGGAIRTWSGTAHVVTRAFAPNAANVLDALGLLDTEFHELRLFLAITVTAGMQSLDTPPGNDPKTLPFVWAYGDAFLDPNNPLPALVLPLTNVFGLTADQRQESPSTPSAVLSWSSYIPKYTRPDTTYR